MKITNLPKALMLASIVSSMFTAASVTRAESSQRTMVVREGSTASLLNGNFTLKVLKIHGYTIDVKVSGQKQGLKIGQSISPANADCTITFQEIATETQIARFTTNC